MSNKKANGIWTLISPDGNIFEGNSPVNCCGKAVRSQNSDISDEERIENIANALSEPVLYKKQVGSRINIANIINQAANICEYMPDTHYPRWEFALRDLLVHLQEMADKFYASDNFYAVDNFLQLYCLDRERVDDDS